MSRLALAQQASQVRDHLTELGPEMVEFLESLVRLESPSDVASAQAPVLDLLQRAFQDLDYRTIRLPVRRFGGHPLRPAASSRTASPTEVMATADRPLRYRLALGHAGQHAHRKGRRPPARSGDLRHEGRFGSRSSSRSGHYRLWSSHRRSSRSSSSTLTRRWAALNHPATSRR